MNLFFKAVMISWLLCILSVTSLSRNLDTNSNLWAYECINIPQYEKGIIYDTVVVAVIDDAFRLDHKELKGFIYRNPNEIPNNYIDDDGNGYIDDVRGWDVSDNDNDVSVNIDRTNEFYHGTYISGIITKTASQYFGEKANQFIKILPIKVISDQADRTYMLDGYNGIKYAIDMGADIICAAWSGGEPGPEELRILEEAEKKGIMIISSDGNFSEEKVLYPAKHETVFAVSGIDKQLQKEARSNYGAECDISAPAESVYGPHPEKPHAYFFDNGTSASAALVTACAAIIKSRYNGISFDEIKEALLNSSTPFEKQTSYSGKLGSGIVNLKKAIDYLNDSDKSDYNSPLRPKGYINITSNDKNRIYEISPPGAFTGFFLNFNLPESIRNENNTILIKAKDTVWNRIALSKLPPKYFVPLSSFKLDFTDITLLEGESINIIYQGKTIDSTQLYCSGLKRISRTEGSLSDGSGEHEYTNNCSCRWIIKVPAGQRIKFMFNEMDTQANVDYVYLVDGRTAIPENIFAKFSGQNLPPEVISSTNEVLVWFVTDQHVTGQGWELEYEAVE